VLHGVEAMGAPVCDWIPGRYPLLRIVALRETGIRFST